MIRLVILIHFLREVDIDHKFELNYETKLGKKIKAKNSSIINYFFQFFFQT